MFLRCCVDKRARCFVGSSIVWRQHDECNACHVGNLTALVREENSGDVSFSFREYLLHLGADTLFGACCLDARTPVGEQLIQVRRQAEPIAVLLGRKVVAGS